MAYRTSPLAPRSELRAEPLPGAAGAAGALSGAATFPAHHSDINRRGSGETYFLRSNTSGLLMPLVTYGWVGLVFP